MLERLGSDGEIGIAGGGPACDLWWRALIDMQRDPRVLAPECADDRGQGIARLGMGGGHAQRTAVGVRELAGGARDVFDFGQNPAGRLQNARPRGGDPIQMLAVAFEHEHAEFVLEQPDLFAHTGLRGMQRLGGGGDIQAPFGDFIDIDELTQFHGGSSLRTVRYAGILLNYKYIFLSDFKTRC